MKINKTAQGVTFCTIAGITFGGQWPVAGTALKIIDPFYFTVIRYLIVAIVLALVLIIVEGKQKLRFEGKQLSLWFYGTMAFAIYNFLVFTGQKMIGEKGAILGSILMALIPLVSVLVLWIYKGIKPPKFTLICIFVALMGVCLVITKGDYRYFLINKSQIFPIVLMLISVLAWVIYTIGGSNFTGWSPLRYTTLSCIMGNLSSIVIIVFLTSIGYIHYPSIQSLSSIGFEMFYMSIISGVIGVSAWNAGNKILNPMNGSLFMNLVPIVAFIVSILSGYKISFIEVFGSIITILALISNNLYQRKAKQKLNTGDQRIENISDRPQVN